MSTNEPEILICDYCDQPAALVGRDGGDLLCAGDGRDQYTDVAVSLAKLTPRTLRMYAPGRTHLREPVPVEIRTNPHPTRRTP